jgi:hypothetical protein
MYTVQLQKYGVPTKTSNNDPAGLHVKILELTALIINLSQGLAQITLNPEYQGIHVLLFCADNIYALVWLREMGDNRNPNVRSLSRLILALNLVSCFPCALQGSHIDGANNIYMDLLSQPRYLPEIQSAFA